ncbi:hypothetical protein Mapa_001131 [Marchantia paleacea]|nr:hypothetical protein Mapa_001131 [Marchantia paleacea]
MCWVPISPTCNSVECTRISQLAFHYHVSGPKVCSPLRPPVLVNGLHNLLRAVVLQGSTQIPDQGVLLPQLASSIGHNVRKSRSRSTLMEIVQYWTQLFADTGHCN